MKNGSDMVSRTNEAFAKVAASSKKASELVGEIAAASNEQARGIEQINKAVAEMDKVVQHNSANAEESSSAAEEMNAQAWRMRDYMKDLMVLLGGKEVDGLVSSETLRMESKDQVPTTHSSHSQKGRRMKLSGPILGHSRSGQTNTNIGSGHHEGGGVSVSSLMESEIVFKK
jgi:ABC-type transporter Mla subunit MlaD